MSYEQLFYLFLYCVQCDSDPLQANRRRQLPSADGQDVDSRVPAHNECGELLYMALKPA